jgi:hypothetical protein
MEAEARRAEERRIAQAQEKEKAEREFKRRVLEVLKEGLAANEAGELEALIRSLDEPSANDGFKLQNSLK